MLTEEQVGALQEVVDDKWSMQVNDEYMEGSIWDGEGDLICTVYCRSDAEIITKLIALAPSLAATVIEQQAEIERLRELLGNVFTRHRAQIEEPLYTAIVMEIDQ